MSQRPNASAINGLVALIIAVLALFIARYYWLQVVDYRRYATESNHHLEDTPLRPLRGEVYARDGRILIGNRRAVDLIYTGGRTEFLDRIARLAKIQAALPTLNPGEEAVLRSNLSDEAIGPLAEWIAGQPQKKDGSLPLVLRERIERYYPTGLAGHLLGYTALAKGPPEDPDYERDDPKGKTGLEAGLEKYLRGRNGTTLLEINAEREIIGERVTQDATAGQSVTLTIDYNLQAATERALEQGLSDLNRVRASHKHGPVPVARGAIVAVNPKTGEVLAYASSPKYDPNWFSRSPKPPELTRALLDTKYKPLMNRPTNIFEPGSTFKLVTTSALLESRFGNRSFPCSPSYVYGRRWKNWNWRHMGMLDARGAIAQSCNTWFYQATVAYGPRAAAELYAARAKDFGFGEPTGIELIGEKAEVIDGPAAYEKKWSAIYGKPVEWLPGFSLNFSIGQGFVRATPLQIARMLSTIVNNGLRPEFTVIKAVEGKAQPPKPMPRISGTHWSTLKEGMTWTVQRGTSKHVLGPALFPIPTMGKTGTAQNGTGLDHSWYMGYGPAYPDGTTRNLPPLVVVAFFENGIEGSGVALPAVKRVMAAYWKVPLDERGNWMRNTQARR